MKITLLYLKFFVWSIINAVAIIILAGVIAALMGVEPLLFVGKLFEEGYINSFVMTSLFKLQDIATMSLSTIPILTSTYILTKPDLDERWKSLAITTSFGILLFAFSYAFILGDGCYELSTLVIVIMLNIYIIYRLSKTTFTSNYKIYSYIFLFTIYIYLIGFSFKLYGLPI